MEINRTDLRINFKGIDISYAKNQLKKPIKAVFSDIDGTILDSHKLVPESTKKAINMLESSGIPVILTTGRGYKSIDYLYNKTGVTPNYAITESGAVIIDKDKNKLLQNTLTLENTLDILNTAHEINAENFRLSFDGDSYIEGSNEAFAATDVSVHSITSFKDMLEAGMRPVRAVFAKMDSKSFADIEPLKQFLMSKFGDKLNVFVSGHRYCEITNKSVSKAFGIEFLRNIFKCEYENMACIGDAENDLSMAELLTKNNGMSISMGNGTQTMKDVSRYITDGIYQDGFLQAAKVILEINKNIS